MWKMRTELHVWQRHFLESQSGWTKRANIGHQIRVCDSIGKCFQGNSTGCAIAEQVVETQGAPGDYVLFRYLDSV